MSYIKVDNKYDFEELVNVLLKNGYQISVSVSMVDDDGNKREDNEIAFYVIEYTDDNE